MSMVIMNNSSAMMALGQLNKNTSKLSKDLEKVSSGMKLNSAGDGSSEYAISERMRVMIRSLDQDKQNVQNGTSLFKVAEGGIQEIIDELRNIRELALNSANDHNTDADRATIQKEYEHKIANIDDIASTTNYNGKILLDGRYGRKSLSLGYVNNPTYVPDLAVVGTVSGSGTFSITADGAYNIDPSFTGTIDIQAENVELIGSSSATLSGVYINGNSSGNQNLILKDVNISNINPTQYTVQFNGTNNKLILKGDSVFNISSTTPGGFNDMGAVEIGDGLTIEGGEATGSLTVNDFTCNSSGLIGRPAFAADNSDAYITINSGILNLIQTSKTLRGAAIGNGTTASGSTTSMGDITINGGEITISNQSMGAGIGTGSGNAIVENIIINDGKITIDKSPFGIDGTYNTSPDHGVGIGAGNGNDTYVENIVIRGGDISIIPPYYTPPSHINVAGPAIGPGHSSWGEPTPSRVENITIYSEAFIDTAGAIGEAEGWNGTVGSVNYIGSMAATKGNPIIIHSGAKANQATNFYINDMRTDALGLTNVALTTQPKAQSALSKIDNAIEYALDEMTAIGSYLSRLEYTESNITTANENVIASESAIRDADMAKSMTEYTKSNVLSQAAQSMLAQANQNASAVLSLLQ